MNGTFELYNANTIYLIEAESMEIVSRQDKAHSYSFIIQYYTAPCHSKYNSGHLLHDDDNNNDGDNDDDKNNYISFVKHIFQYNMH